MEDMGLTDGSQDSDVERDMVKGGAGVRCEERVGEQGTKLEVEEHSIQPSQGRALPFVTPGIMSIEERKFNPCKVINAGNEAGGEQRIKVWHILLMG